MPRYAVGIDVGGTSARIALVGEDGTLLFQNDASTGIDATGEYLLDRLRQGIRAALDFAAARRIAARGLGLAVPAFVDQEGRVAGSCNLPGLNGMPLCSLLGKECGLPVRMENDVSAATLGEYHFGGHAGSSRMLFVAIGTGIGAGMIVDGELLRLSQGCLGDPGHVIVEPSGNAPCRCGGNGCLEAVASGWALVERAGRLGVGATPKDIFDAARSGDSAMSTVAAETARYIGVGLATLCVLLNPDTIVLGGGVALEAGETLRARAEQTMRDHAVPFFSRHVRVVLTNAGPSAGVLGAAALALFRKT